MCMYVNKPTCPHPVQAGELPTRARLDYLINLVRRVREETCAMDLAARQLKVWERICSSNSSNCVSGQRWAAPVPQRVQPQQLGMCIA